MSNFIKPTMQPLSTRQWSTEKYSSPKTLPKVEQHFHLIGESKIYWWETTCLDCLEPFNFIVNADEEGNASFTGSVPRRCKACRKKMSWSKFLTYFRKRARNLKK